jgi:hypothetical protein
MVWLGPENAELSEPSVIAEGIVSATLIATPEGWRAAGSLGPGARVLTFDHGPQAVVSAHIQPISGVFPSHWPLLVPSWALDNREDLVLLPEQKLLIEADVAETLFGDPFALIPAVAMDGWRGIGRWRPTDGMAAVVLGFAEPQLIYASRGVLLSCPGDPFAVGDWYAPGLAACSLTQARHLIACLMAEEAGAALRKRGQRQFGVGAD